MTYAKLPKILAINNKTFIFCYTINIINRSEEHTSELQSQSNLVCRLLLEKKKNLHCTISSAFQAPPLIICVTPLSLSPLYKKSRILTRPGYPSRHTPHPTHS